MLTDIYTDLTTRITDALDDRTESRTVEYGALDDVLAQAAVHDVTIALDPAGSEWEVSGDAADITLVSQEFTVGVHVEGVPDLRVTTMAVIDAITRALHGEWTDDSPTKVMYFIRSVSHGTSTQSTDRYTITLTAETYYYA